MNKLKLMLLTILAMLSLAINLQPAYALQCSDPQTTADKLKCGTCVANGGTCPDKPANSLSDTVTSIINILSVVGGLAAVIMIIIAGFRYVTSAGNAEAAKGARQTILYAVIGLIIISFAQLIVHFVLKNINNPPTSSSSSSASSGSGRTGAGPGERPN